MTRPLILSLFPGADLFGRAFENLGCCVVRGPEALLGQRIEEWPLPPPGIFDGVIGGPPCQSFSKARNIGGHPARHADMAGMFWRIVAEIRPKWAVMENLTTTVGHPDILRDTYAVVLRDWDCGGKTNRKRVFHVWPGRLILAPDKSPGTPAWTVLASSYKSGNRRKAGHMHVSLTARQAGELQGYPEIAEAMMAESQKSRLFAQRFVVHCLGNGVPKAMGSFIARNVLSAYGHQGQNP